MAEKLTEHEVPNCLCLRNQSSTQLRFQQYFRVDSRKVTTDKGVKAIGWSVYYESGARSKAVYRYQLLVLETTHAKENLSTAAFTVRKRKISNCTDLVSDNTNATKRVLQKHYREKAVSETNQFYPEDRCLKWLTH